MGEWRRKALEIQQELYEKLGDRRWDRIQSGQRWALESKVGFAMFGEPTEDNTANIGYTKEKYEEIKKTCDLIYEVGGCSDVLVAFLFLIGESGEGMFVMPLFRVKKRSGDSVFIDHLGRVYESWSDFMESNKLPVCEFSYPRSGIYEADASGNVLASFAESPASSLNSRALNALDVTSSVATVAAATIGVASLFVPFAGPVIAAATWSSAGCGVYGLSRGTYELVDRSKHNQTISPLDSNARNLWLSVVGSALGVGNGLAMKGMIGMAARGEVLSKAGRIAVDMLNFGSLTVNGLGIANGMAQLIEKNKRDELTTLDLIQFTSSVLFFTNAAMNAQTAKSIIQQVQSETLSSFKADLSNRRGKAFSKLMKNSGGEGTMHDNARIIKGITNVGSKDEFFRMTIRAQKQGASTVMNSEGNLVVNGKPYVDTDVRLQTHVKTNTKLGPVPNVEMMKLNAVTKELGPDSLYSRYRRLIKLSDGVEFELTEDMIETMRKLCKRYLPSSGEGSSQNVTDSISQSEMFARERGCSTKEDYIDFAHFLIIYKNGLLKDMEKKYDKAKIEAKEFMKDLFDESLFDRKWRIQDSNDRKDSFLNVINQSINDSNEHLKNAFDKYNEDVAAINQDGGLGFRRDYLALNAFYHSFVIDRLELTPREFFVMIRRAANDENGLLRSTYCENFRRVTYTNRDVGLFVLVVERGRVRHFESVSFVSEEELERMNT